MVMGYCRPLDLEERRALISRDATKRGEVRGENGYQYGVFLGSSLVFSAPHQEPHFREGVEKIGENGTADLAMMLADYTRGTALYTTGVQLGDPNWDESHEFSKEIQERSVGGAVVDLHIMRNRGVEVCLGLGIDHELSRPLWQPLLDEFLNADVRVSVNWPFGGRGRPITSKIQRLGVPALQIEMVPEVFDDNRHERACVVSALLMASRTWRDLFSREQGDEFES
jgi:hypothetical protein